MILRILEFSLKLLKLKNLQCVSGITGVLAGGGVVNIFISKSLPFSIYRVSKISMFLYFFFSLGNPS